MTPAQLRAARGLLGWTREELKSASGVSAETIRNIEHGRYQPTPETVHKLQLTFVNQGVGFFDLLARHQLWGVVLQPPQASEQDNQPLTGPARARQERLLLIVRMATVIADIIRRHGHCPPSELEAKGFTSDEIAMAWSFASALAHVELREPGE